MMQLILMLLICLKLLLILISVWLLFFQLIKQHGRLLWRQDGLEHRLAHFGLGAAANGLAVLGDRPQPRGLPEGTPFSAFRLPDLAGREISLENLRGKGVLIIHWNPHCSFCGLIAPDLAKLQAELAKHNVHALLVSRGDTEANIKLAEEHGLQIPILVQERDAAPLDAFRGLGTPVAYLLDEQGRVARPLAVGADRVSDLAYELAASGLPERESAPDVAMTDGKAPGVATRRRLPGERPLSESKIERNGLKAGTPAPAFSLPDLTGRVVSLEEYRGRQVLLVFSDPHCGPCDQLAPVTAAEKT